MLRLVLMFFYSEPHNFSELATCMSNYALVDSMAHPLVPPLSALSLSRSMENLTRRPVRCYHYGRPGHMVRDCFRQHRQTLNLVPAVSSNADNANAPVPSQCPLDLEYHRRSTIFL